MTAKPRCLSLLVALIGILGSGTPLPAADIVNVAAPSRVIFAIPFWIAERKGFFKDEGIEAKLEIIGDGRRITEQLRSGTTQFTIIGPDFVLTDAYQGGSLRIVAGIVRRPPLFLIAKREIRTFADLRGAHFGVLSLTEGSAKLLAKMAKAEGLAPGDYRISAVGGAPARWTLLKEGKIDAGLQPLLLNYEAEAAGFNNLGWAGTYEPEWQFTTVNANGDWARRHPEVASRFLRALLRGQQLLRSHPDEAAQIAAAELRTPVTLAARSLADSARLGLFDPRLDWSEAGLARIFENMQADGVIPPGQPFDLNKVVDAEYLRKAQSSVASSSGK